jgi:hypothetical protein
MWKQSTWKKNKTMFDGGLPDPTGGHWTLDVTNEGKFKVKYTTNDPVPSAPYEGVDDDNEAMGDADTTGDPVLPFPPSVGSTQPDAAMPGPSAPPDATQHTFQAEAARKAKRPQASYGFEDAYTTATAALDLANASNDASRRAEASVADLFNRYTALNNDCRTNAHRVDTAIENLRRDKDRINEDTCEAIRKLHISVNELQNRPMPAQGPAGPAGPAGGNAGRDDVVDEEEREIQRQIRNEEHGVRLDAAKFKRELQKAQFRRELQPHEHQFELQKQTHEHQFELQKCEYVMENEVMTDSDVRRQYKEEFKAKLLAKHRIPTEAHAPSSASGYVPGQAPGTQAGFDWEGANAVWGS